MSTIKKPFDAYRIWCYSGAGQEAIVQCYQGTVYVGRMVFYKDEATIPPNQNFSSGPSVHYPVSRLNEILSILRQEKPLYLFMNLISMVGILATDEREPVGEEES